MAEPKLSHSERFRFAGDRFPRRVAEAYGGDLTRAMADSDEQVFATVASWEKRQGLPVRDWPAMALLRGERDAETLGPRLGRETVRKGYADERT